MSLEHLLNPRGIAVVGASDRRTSNGFIVTSNLVSHGYAGRIVPVSPRLDQLLGLACVPSLKACAGQVDLAVLMVRADRLAALYTEAAETGVGAVSIAGDLPGGAELDIVRGVLAAGGPRILGAGSMGVIDCHRAVTASMSSALRGRRLPRGGLAVLSQSGGLLGSLLNRAADQGIGISKAVSLGQEFDIGLGEVIGHLADDPETATIACVIEGLHDPDGFVAGVRRAHAAGKQVSVYRIGRSAAGQQSALAHSGALAVPDRTYEGLFDQLGVLQVDSPHDLLSVVYADPAFEGFDGTAVGAASLSGGSCGAFADACATAGVDLASPSAATMTAAGVPGGETHNPVDLVSNAMGPEVTEEVLARGLTALEADPSVAAVVYADSTLLPVDEVADVLIARHTARTKPLVVAWDLGSMGSQAFTRLQRARVPAFRSLHVAARWLRLALRRRPDLRLAPSDGHRVAQAAGTVEAVWQVATEAELSPLLESVGIPVLRGRFVRDAAAAAEAAREFAGPVALKAVSPRLPHRHSAGALVLNLRSGPDTAAAAQALFTRHGLDGAREGLLVQPMVDIGDEYFVGLHRDPLFGLLLLFGKGGVNVEREGHVVARRLPVTAGEVAAMVTQVAEDAPVTAISEAAFRLCELGQALGERLVSLEVNPLVVPADRPEAVLAIDALAAFTTLLPEAPAPSRPHLNEENHV
ncbi:acetate--CoA ligase family protein [Streptomyces gramineus]|uniref:acetate--CoA ligase family protein n=1 Tax=Streptomyces gramineus TaxID=910542 RepID=UPI00398AE300